MFWPCFWLLLVLVAAKAAHPDARLRDLFFLVHQDVWYVLTIGAIGQTFLWLTAGRSRAHRAIWRLILIWCVASVMFAVASIAIFHARGAFLDFGAARFPGNTSTHIFDVRLVVAMIAAAAIYLLLVGLCESVFKPRRVAIPVVFFLIMLIGVCDELMVGRMSFDRRLGENPHWVLIWSCL